jgi:hypothetical protein
MTVRNAATVPPFDQVAVAVAPGGDLVVRMPGIVLVVAVEGTSAPPPDRPPLGGWGAPAVAAAPVPADDRRAGELVELCRRVSSAGTRAPGRRLHDELRSWLESASGLPSFAVAAATEEGLAIGLVGAGVAEVPDLGLRLTPADGERLPDGTAFLDRLVDWPPAALRLSAGAPPGAAPHPLADLSAGAVPGAAAVLSPAPAGPRTPLPEAPPPTAQVRLPAPGALLLSPRAAGAVMPPVAGTGVPPVPAAALARPAPHHGAAAGHDPARHDASRHDHAGHGTADGPPPVELPTPVHVRSLLAPDPAEVASPRPPLPIVSTEQPPAALVRQPGDPRPDVPGVLCPQGHLNDPRLPFCALCGVRMAQQPGVLVEGVRPPLGLLVFDNGAAVTLDADYLLGREPETDERVRSGQLRPLLVVDPTGGVSRRHAEIRLEGWDVVLVDTGSANGTLVAPPGAPAWASLVPGRPVRLLPGTAVRMGGRQFVFESPHGGS